ncbi:MAG: DUF4325 domain-containing protein [candidate division WOR-3 bacterium]|nr:MAG: DUF4325 domain-containing protein [candidate division WOR-3 bacterium]
MKTMEEILRLIKQERAVSGKEIQEHLGISRQAMNKHLKKLIQKGEVLKIGSTKGAMYRIAGKIIAPEHFRKVYLLKGLEEDKAFSEIVTCFNLRKKLRKNVFDLINHAFTEILNNAIEHSLSSKCRVEILVDQYVCKFLIRDFGIGIFHSIRDKFGLKDEYAAVGELIKGKTTTMKERHTGEGVFFTSKSGDRVVFRSHKTNLIFDNLKGDIIVEEKKFVKGTEVEFGISRKSRRDITGIFRFYAPEEFDYGFEKTKVFVKLFQREYVSRSEAKRMLFGLDKFREIILNFKGVRSLGQGFVDEIFRVFQKQHPEIKISVENVNPSIAPILMHTVDYKN